MKIKHYLQALATCVVASLFIIGCAAPADEKAPDSTVAGNTMQAAAKPDMAKIKADIQALETSWAAADNARDTNAVAAFYADDAITLSNNKPMLVGKEAIQKDIAAGISKRAKGATVAYDVSEVFGDENTVTEIGKITTKDADGKVTYTGKYMAIWEKRDGKYVCIRDISNDDVKPK